MNIDICNLKSCHVLNGCFYFLLNLLAGLKDVAEVAKQLGGKITIKAFTRFATGEGIEKKEDDFAAEVASMIK